MWNAKIRYQYILLILVWGCAQEGDIGEQGYSTLVASEYEAAGINCPGGGLKIESGVDFNRNNQLDTEEIKDIDFLCSTVDQQIRLDFGGTYQHNQTSWSNTNDETHFLIKFDKRNYAQVDSIIFSGSLFSSDPGNKCSVRLFNITDGVAIPNSVLESSENNYVFMDSPNLYASLPNKEVSLVVQVKSENSGISVSTGAKSSLFLYRD